MEKEEEEEETMAAAAGELSVSMGDAMKLLGGSKIGERLDFHGFVGSSTQIQGQLPLSHVNVMSST